MKIESKTWPFVKYATGSRILLLVACLSAATFLRAGRESPPAPVPMFVEVQIDATAKLSHLKPGDILQGKIRRNVYSGDHQLFPAGSPVRLTVGKLECRRSKHNDHWPWVVQLFAPRHENYPSFQSAEVSLASGIRVPLRFSVVSAMNEIDVAAKKKVWQPKPVPRPMLNLQAERPQVGAFPSPPCQENTPGEVSSLSAPAVAAGTHALLILMQDLSASKNRAGDAFQARLVEPLCAASNVMLPEGALFAGRVVKSVRPGRLSRPGSLHLTFTSLTLPTGEGATVAASLSEAEVDQGSRMRMDSEGGLSGGSPGMAHLMVDLGITTGIAKVTDDSFQLLAEAIISTATDASTAGSARIIATAFSGLLSRHAPRAGRGPAPVQYSRHYL